MNKRNVFLIAFLLFCLFCSQRTHAQTWDWGVGSISPGTDCESWLIAMDSMGNVYEAGETSPAYLMDTAMAIFGTDTVYAISFTQIVLVSADSTGAYRWAISSSGGSASIIGIAADPSGNIYLIGVYNLGAISMGTHSVGSGLPTYFIGKINSSGNVLWLKNINSGTSSTGNGSMVMDDSDNIYITGTFTGSSITIGATTLFNHDVSGVTSDVFVAKIDSSGTPVWAKSFGGDSSEFAQSIAVTNRGDIYLAGQFYSDTMIISGDTLANDLLMGAINRSPYLYITKYDHNGDALWARKIAAYDALSATPLYTAINGLATDYHDNVYLTGNASTSLFFDSISVSGSMPSAFLAAYGPSGNLKFANSLAATILDSTFTFGFHIALDNCNNVWVSGGGYFGPSWDGMFLSEFDTSGTLINSVVQSSGGDDQNSFVLDNKGHIYVGGDYDYLSPPMYVGPDTIASIDSSYESLFILKLSYPYSFCPACVTPSVSFTDTGTLTFGFTYTGTTSGVDSLVWDYGDGATDAGITSVHTYSASGTYTVCVTAYTSCGGESYCSTVMVATTGIPVLPLSSIQVFPNPATKSLTIQSATEAITQITITNLLGQTVCTQQPNAKTTQVNIVTLPTGIYFIKINGSEVRKFLKE